MRESFQWFKKILMPVSRKDVLALVTPEIVRDRNPIVRVVVGVGTLAALAASALVGMGALALLLVAVAAVYYLTTQVLGLKVNVDPQAFAQQFYKQAQQYSN